MQTSRALYRTRQVLLALRPRLEQAELTQALHLLLPGEQRLFLAMQKRDQRHALEVLRRLQALDASADEIVLKAALLHDCGKGEVPVWLRIARVLRPRLVERLAAQGAAGWRGSAFRLVHHAEIGARLARQAGSGERLCAFIAGRVSAADERWLGLLIEADDAS